jgi:hypothetical protein
LSSSVRRFNAFSHELDAPRSHAHPMAIVASRRWKHWDSDSSGTRKRQTRFGLDDRRDLLTREDGLDMHRADLRDSRCRTRQSHARWSALVKLRAIGTFMCFSRECAALRVLFDGDQVTPPTLAMPLTVRRAVVAHTWIGAWRAAAAVHLQPPLGRAEENAGAARTGPQSARRSVYSSAKAAGGSSVIC